MNNNHLVLVSGKSSSGKSASLLNMDKPEGVMYLNCENGKKLPFKSKFKEHTVTDPDQVYQAFAEAEKMKDIHSYHFQLDSLYTYHKCTGIHHALLYLPNFQVTHQPKHYN